VSEFFVLEATFRALGFVVFISENIQSKGKGSKLTFETGTNGLFLDPIADPAIGIHRKEKAHLHEN
jgi:hypothetical protein